MMLLVLLGACDLLDEKPARSVKTAAAEPMALLGRAAVEGDRLVLYNDGSSEWTNTVATANNALICNIGLVHPNDQAGIKLSNCSGGPLASPVVMVRVAATQGYFEAAVGSTLPTAPAPAPTAPAPAPATPKPSTAVTPVAKPRATVTDSSTTTVAVATEAPVMSLAAKMSGGVGPARRLTVFNTSTFAWTACEVIANDLYSYTLPMLNAGEQNGIMMFKFRDQTGNIFTSGQQVNKVKVKCDQGSASAQPT